MIWSTRPKWTRLVGAVTFSACTSCSPNDPTKLSGPIPPPVGAPDGGTRAADAESANCTVLASTSGEILDGAGNTWTLRVGPDRLSVYENGAAAGLTSSVLQLSYVNHVVWHEEATAGWYRWAGSSWSSGSDPMGACLRSPGDGGSCDAGNCGGDAGGADGAGGGDGAGGADGGPDGAGELAGWTESWAWHAQPGQPIFQSGGGPFSAAYVDFGWLRRLDGNQEQQVFVEPGAWPGVDVSDVVFYNAARACVTIQPRVATAAETAITGYYQTSGPFQGLAIFSGQLSTDQNAAAAFTNGAFRIVARMPGNGTGGPAFKGAWPSIVHYMYKYGQWELPPSNPLQHKWVEWDVLEQPNTFAAWYISDHAETPFDAPPEVPHSDVSMLATQDGFHTWDSIITTVRWRVYFDGQLVSDRPRTEVGGHGPVYSLVNLTIGGSWPGNVDSGTDLSQWALDVREMHVYALPAGYDGTQPLPLGH